MFAYIDPGTGLTITTAAGWLVGMAIGMLGVISAFAKQIFRFFRKHTKAFFLFLTLCLAGGFLVWLNMSSGPFNQRIIILAFDGMSPVLTEEMMNEGTLPNFSELSRRGGYTHLATTNPAQSPVAWAGFATGQNPGKHGIFDFIHRNPENYSLDLSISHIKGGKPQRVVHAPTFWERVSGRKIPVVVLGGPLTFPPGKVHGRILSGMGVPDFFGSVGTSAFYTTGPSPEDPEAGGHFFKVSRAPVKVMNLIGPKVQGARKTAEPIRVPFKATSVGDERIRIQYQNEDFELAQGKWSGWKEVRFKIGTFKTVSGILKFYLVETQPEFKLYAGPIQLDPRAPYFRISYPDGYSRELAEEIGLYYTAGMPMDTSAVNAGRLPEGPFLEEAETVFNERNRMLDYELGRFERGVLFSYFESTDIIQHMFWHYTDPGHPMYEPDAPAYKRDVIRSWYVKMDQTLGRVLNRMRADDILFVLSDHGMDTYRRSAHVNTWLRKEGYLELKDPAAESGRQLFSDVDWSRTRAYAAGLGGIYFNQAGRERDGIVQPGEESQRLTREIAQKLAGWTDEKDGQPIVHRVYTRDEIFRGPRAGDSPDLYIGFNIGYSASRRTARGAVPATLVEDNTWKWSGTHLVDPDLTPGILLCNRPLTKPNPSIYDIAPTVLKLIGYSQEELAGLQMDGSPVFD